MNFLVENTPLGVFFLNFHSVNFVKILKKTLTYFARILFNN